eukprot:751984-Pyramimonas_sp.AAC.1
MSELFATLFMSLKRRPALSRSTGKVRASSELGAPDARIGGVSVPSTSLSLFVRRLNSSITSLSCSPTST